MRVCVIGAGAAGLCAARHLSKLPGKFLPVVYESSNVIGGTWVYTDEVGKDSYGNPIHSSMYQNLRTNLPKEVMAFPDFPFEENDQATSSFLHHSEVRQYLEDYSAHFNLERFIQFETVVDKVEPLEEKEDNCLKWNVQTTCLQSKESKVSQFDSVLVCNGHYSVPLFPKIKEIERFNGSRDHSHNYRTPEPFESKVVAVLGAASSGLDISLEISKVARQVYLCHDRNRLQSKLPSNVTEVRGIAACITDYGFILNDGSKIQVDSVLFCTGYEFNFPFLDSANIISNDGQVVKPLYKHMIHTKYPSLAFIGIPTQICPFPFFHNQLLWLCKVLLGKYRLPTEADMNADIEEERLARLDAGLPPRHFHKMGVRQWEYSRDLAKRAGMSEISPAVEELYNQVHQRRLFDLTEYKNERYVMGKDGHYILFRRNDR